MPTFSQLKTKARKHKTALQMAELERAHQFADLPQGSKAMSEAYAVADILLDFLPDQDAIISSLLLQYTEEEKPSWEEIEKNFGTSVCRILQSLQKLTVLTKISLQNPKDHSNTLRKMFLALAQDVRVVFIKLANRLYTLRNASSLPQYRRQQYAREVLDLYAPIAARLGIYRLKEELENLAFPILFPSEHAHITAQVETLRISRKKILEEGEMAIRLLLAKNKLPGKVQGRIKDPYSIYRKLQRKQTMNLKDIYDLFAFRILLQTVGQCYSVLGHVHQQWQVCHSRFKDYIASPKPNGYKSLHTTVCGVLRENMNTHPVEIQIRTFDMHEEAEFGSAVHWHYKEAGEKGDGPVKNWFMELAKTSANFQESDNFLIFAKDILGAQIFVLTEQGDIKFLPEHATPIDFAYAVHSEVGNHCQGALVNGRVEKLDYELQNGDVVKILTNKNVFPRESWLSLATASSTRQKIRAFLRKHDYDFFIRQGREQLNATLKKFEAPLLDAKLTILKRYGDKKNLNLKQRENILHRIGIGDISAQVLARKIANIPLPEKRRIPLSNKSKEKERVIVAGESGFQFKKAQCCSPKPSDMILAYTTRGGGFTIHRSDCKVLHRSDTSRFLSARWEHDPVPHKAYLRLEKKFERSYLLQEITQVLMKYGVHLSGIHSEEKEISKEETAKIYLVAEILRPEILQTLISQLQKIPGIGDISLISAEEIPYVSLY